MHSNFVGMPAPKPNIGDEMPKGPQGQERPIDVIGCEVKIAKITTGEAEDTKIEQILEKKLIDTPTQKR